MMAREKHRSIKSATRVGVGRKAGKGEHYCRLQMPDPKTALWLCRFDGGKDNRCSIYVIAPDGGWPVKIGVSQKPDKRIATLQTASWKRLEVAACYWVESTAAAVKLEKAVHDKFASEDKWLLGEWVDARADEAAEAIQWAALIESIVIDDRVPDDKLESVKREISRRWPIEAVYESNAAYFDRHY